MKKFLFILLVAIIACTTTKRGPKLGRVPAHPIKKFFDSLRKEGILEKIKEKFTTDGQTAAIDFCMESIPEIPDFVKPYFATRRALCQSLIPSLK